MYVKVYSSMSIYVFLITYCHKISIKNYKLHILTIPVVLLLSEYTIYIICDIELMNTWWIALLWFSKILVNFENIDKLISTETYHESWNKWIIFCAFRWKWILMWKYYILYKILALWR